MQAGCRYQFERDRPSAVTSNSLTRANHLSLSLSVCVCVCVCLPGEVESVLIDCAAATFDRLLRCCRGAPVWTGVSCCYRPITDSVVVCARSIGTRRVKCVPVGGPL